MFTLEGVLLGATFVLLGAIFFFSLNNDESDRRQAYWARYDDK